MSIFTLRAVNEAIEKAENSLLNCDLGFSVGAVGNIFLCDWVYQFGASEGILVKAFNYSI